ncbi:MAG: sigma-54 dependent transcriptional regulator [Thermoguttaceae bacterium]|jgi:DNA-binding NtrC family response regulator
MSVGRDFNSVEAFIGASPFAAGIRRQIVKIAPHSSNVLITGPSGTGKELIARAIHAHSPRADKPFIAVDCAGATGPLFTGHLFGHVKGAFTGADHSALGCFRAADGGTILLDEIGELSRDLQAKLLRVLQERVVTPLGSHAMVPVDVRVIAATNCDLEQMVASGHFREDLFYRLNVVAIKTIPLRDRPEDIVPLSQYFLQKMASRLGVPAKELSCHCSDCMLRHDWPGNVRELENFLEQAVLFSSENTIRPDTAADIANRICICPVGASLARQQRRECVPLSDDLATSAAPSAAGEATASADPWPTLDQLQRDHIQRTLQRTGYNQRAAADLLGLHRQQLLRKIKKYGLDTSSSRPGRPNKPPSRRPGTPPALRS